jgi:hypothetical protein
MSFFDFKFVIIILFTIIIYLMYREIIDIKYKVKYLIDNNKLPDLKKKHINKNNILSDFNKDNILSDFNKDNILSDFNKETIDKNNILSEERLEKNKCFIKTIKIPINLDSLFNPFQQKQKNIQINELSPIIDDEELSPIIDDEELSPINNDKELSPINNDEELSPINNNEELLKNTSPEITQFYENNNIQNKLEIINSEGELLSDTKNEITENNTDNKSYASSSHIEIYSNDDSNINLSLYENISKESNIDYKNILKNLNKYKLPELQDISFQFKLPIENNNKRKTRIELIDEIKNYIINKNI